MNFKLGLNLLKNQNLGLSFQIKIPIYIAVETKRRCWLV